MEHDIYICTETKTAWSSLTDSRQPRTPSRLQTHLKLNVYFFDSTAETPAATLLDGATTFRVAMKPSGTPAADPLIYLSTASETGSASYTFEWDSIDSADLRALVGTEKSVDVVFEISWTLATVIERVAWNAVVENAYIRSGDGAPDPIADSSWEWLKLRAPEANGFSHDDAEQELTVVGGDGSGDVVGPASATDNAIVRFNATTGKLIQSSGITIADGASGTLSGTNTGDDALNSNYETGADVTDAGNVGTAIAGADAVTTINDADKLPLTVSGVLKTIAYSALKTVLNALYLLKSNNLSDLASASTARSNLGLGSAAVLNTSTGGVGVDDAGRVPVFRAQGQIGAAQIIAQSTSAAAQQGVLDFNGLTFVQHGGTAFDHIIAGAALTATRTHDLPDSSGTIITTGDTGSVATTMIADDAVTLAKMAAGTAGNLITYDAAGNPAAVATGTATHVLTSNGAGAAPTFQAVPGGAPEGTAVKSTGETGGSKFLREDGDGTCSWQTVAGTGDMTKAVYDSQNLGLISGLQGSGGGGNSGGVGGSLDLSGGDSGITPNIPGSGVGGTGGNIHTYGGNGFTTDPAATDYSGGNGGYIKTTGSDAVDGAAGAAGGSIDTSAVGGQAGGSIDTSAGGGSIDTHSGGGSINTRGTGSIEFGVAATRTTLVGSATAARTITLPDVTGTVITTGNLSSINGTSTALGVGTLELGHASDTTLARSSAGNVTVEGNLLYRAGGSFVGMPVEYSVAVSDETTALTTGTAKVTFRMPFAMTLTSVRASVTTAPTGSTLIVDINDGGSTIMTTNKLSIDASEKTSTTAATAATLTDTALADDAEITIDIDQIGSTIAGAGLKVTLIGTRA